MKLACIDNHILIWGVRKHATPGQEAMLDMTAAFLAWLDRQKIKVVVPAPVLYEFLCGYELHQQNAIRSIVEQNFIVAPFDTPASMCAATMWKSNRESGLMGRMTETNDALTRQRVKMDHQIAGIAMARKADVLYTEDDGLYGFAQPFITVARMPRDIGLQTKMPTE